MDLGPISAISAMVAPVVLVTVGGLLVNGTTLAWTQAAQRVFDLTREQAARSNVTDADRRRLADIDTELLFMEGRLRGLRRAAITLLAAIGYLVLAVIFIGTAIAANSLVIAYVALALVLGGTLIEFAGIALLATQAFHQPSAAQYAAGRRGLS